MSIFQLIEQVMDHKTFSLHNFDIALNDHLYKPTFAETKEKNWQTFY